ncbi:MAG TPA: DEAD/DEAH box helicase, partial [Kaistia sp.]|nr:DEAD/DEAH box helicase [Kaistia sp.]
MTESPDAGSSPDLLPAPFLDWFARRGWAPRQHQLALLQKAREGHSALLIAPTGAGKTLAGFLPSLVDLATRPPAGKGGRGPHTLYISPLKALAVDIARNLEAPVAEIGLKIAIETRTGDTPAHKRQRQKLKPPEILLTTPEQLALLISNPDAGRFFGDLETVIFDELHALVTAKRGDLLSLGLARLRKLAPGLRAVGLSATVSEPDDLRAWLMPQAPEAERVLADLVTVSGGAKPEITILDTEERLPWAGHSAVHAIGEIYEAVRANSMVLVF